MLSNPGRDSGACTESPVLSDMHFECIGDDRQKILSRSLPIRSRFRRAFGAIGMKRIDNFFKLFPPFIQKRKISGITNIPGHTGGINQELPAVFYLKIFFFFSFRIIFSFFLRSSAMIFSFTLEIISKLIRFLKWVIIDGSKGASSR
jgi:hypothetical protein